MSEQAEKDPAQVLEDAADLLLIHGRCTGEVVNGAGEHCVVGALADAAGLPVYGICIQTYELPARVALERHLAQQGETPVLDGRASAWTWNDTTRDDSEVIDTLRHVAKDLRNEAKQ